MLADELVDGRSIADIVGRSRVGAVDHDAGNAQIEQKMGLRGVAD